MSSTRIHPIVPSVLGLLAASWGPAVSAQTYDQPVGIACIANLPHTGIVGPNATYAALPRGRVTFGGVPFAIPESGDNIWHADLVSGPNPRTVDIPVGIRGVTEVHTLINTAWGVGGPASYAAVEFFGSNGARHSVPLVGNDDIRDFANYVHTNSINGKTTVQVWSDRGARLDKQRFVLPGAFATETLTHVRLIDNGGAVFQRVFLVGLTVRSSTPPVLGQARDLGGGCGAGGTCTVEGTLSPGAPLQIRLAGAGPMATAGSVLLGLPNQTFACGPCTVQLPLVLLPLALQAGGGQLGTRVPCDRGLLGFELVTQWLVPGSGQRPCPIAPGASVSNRVAITIGY